MSEIKGSDLIKIIRECGNSGVSKFEFGEVKIEFNERRIKVNKVDENNKEVKERSFIELSREVTEKFIEECADEKIDPNAQLSFSGLREALDPAQTPATIEIDPNIALEEKRDHLEDELENMALENPLEFEELLASRYLEESNDYLDLDPEGTIDANA